MRLSAAILFAIVFQCALEAAPKWLAVTSTSPSVEAAIARAKELRAWSGKGIVVVSNDCTNLKPGLFLTAAGMSNDKESAQRTVSEVRNRVSNAYVRECEPKPRSRVDFGIDAIDASIFDVPPEAVNWNREDRISEVLAGGAMSVWIRRRYLKEHNDPREGRRTSIFVFKGDPSSARELSPDCTDAEVAVSGNLVALGCARESAGDNLLHQVWVTDTASWRTVLKVERCRNPKFVTSRELTCDSETIGLDGALKLTRKRLPVQ